MDDDTVRVNKNYYAQLENVYLAALEFLTTDSRADNKAGFNRLVELCAESMEPEKKPPLGIVPEKIHNQKRIAEISGAISRYSDVNKVIPSEWLDELSDLFERLT